MGARYLVVDVFAREPLSGNALAVFPDPGSVDPARMQRVAREINLSETTFVTGARDGSYDVRIFTPTDELPFSGHPTLGTAWVLRRLGVIDGDRATQRSGAGETPVAFEGDVVWLERGGSGGEDLDDAGGVLAAFGIAPETVGFDAAALGAPARALRPAIADAGIPQLMLPLADPGAVAALRAPPALDEHLDGVYLFAPAGPGRIKARFFAPGIGVSEDPATGSAAAALGLYLGARAGTLSLRIEQGAEVGRPSLISLRAEPGRVRVGGEVRAFAEATLVG